MSRLDEALRQMFDAMDTDGNGFIDMAEFVHVNRKLARHFDREFCTETVQRDFAALDTNKDDQISFEEFCEDALFGFRSLSEDDALSAVAEIISISNQEL